MESESSIERKICRYAKSRKILTFKLTSPGKRGVPDRIFIRDGKVLFLEIKKPNGRLSKLQSKVLDDLRMRGGIVTETCYSAEEGIGLIDIVWWRLKSNS